MTPEQIDRIADDLDILYRAHENTTARIDDHLRDLRYTLDNLQDQIDRLQDHVAQLERRVWHLER